MGLFDRIGRVVKANINDLVSKAEDPEKILEQSIEDMKEDLVQLKQAVVRAIAAQKQTEMQYNKAQGEANKWQNNAQLAIQKGNDDLAKQALQQKKTNAETATMLKTQLDQQVTQIDALKRNLIQLESKISEARTKKDMLKARVAAAKANEQLQSTVNSLNTGSAMGAFERMEEKVQLMEARSQAAGQLAGADLESQFAALEAGDDIDEELAAMKAQMLAPASQPTQALPPSNPTTASQSNAAVEDELETLRKQMNQM